MPDIDPRQQWRSVYAASNAAGWRAQADELRREADICDARALSAGPGIIQGQAPQSDIGGGVQPVKRQLVDDVVRDLVSRYPGTVQAVSLPTPDTAMVRLHRDDSTWLVSIARLEVSRHQHTRPMAERACAGCEAPATECESQGWCCQSCRETKGGSHA